MSDWRIAGAFVLLAIGFVAGASAPPVQATPDVDEEPATVECQLFEANESPAAICFSTGDVNVTIHDEEWSMETSSFGGNVTLKRLPANNSTQTDERN